ncbi:hypothetical protein WP1_266 [Pseudomonas phage WP1]
MTTSGLRKRLAPWSAMVFSLGPCSPEAED